MISLTNVANSAHAKCIVELYPLSLSMSCKERIMNEIYGPGSCNKIVSQARRQILAAIIIMQSH